MLHPVEGVANVDVPVAALLDFCSFAAVALQGTVTCGKTTDDEHLNVACSGSDDDGRDLRFPVENSCEGFNCALAGECDAKTRVGGDEDARVFTSRGIDEAAVPANWVMGDAAC